MSTIVVLNRYKIKTTMFTVKPKIFGASKTSSLKLVLHTNLFGNSRINLFLKEKSLNLKIFSHCYYSMPRTLIANCITAHQKHLMNSYEAGSRNKLQIS